MISAKAIIFDMDGVLVDSEPHHIRSERRMFEKMQIPISQEEHALFMGTATDVMWSRIIENKQLDLELEEMVAMQNRETHLYFSGLPYMEPMSGLVSLLKQIKKQGIPMAVASSSSVGTIDIVMERSGLRSFFEHVVSSSVVGKSKPAPDVFLYAAQLLQTPPEDCMVIEDSTNGVRAAKAAGMYCVAYAGASSEGQDHSLADRIIYDYAELEELVTTVIDGGS